MKSLRIYPVTLSMIRTVAPLMEAIERRDRDLASQGRSAASSVALNTAEGSCSRGRNRQARYHTACASANETLSVLEVADAWGWGIDPEPHRDMFNEIIGTLAKLSGIPPQRR